MLSQVQRKGNPEMSVQVQSVGFPRSWSDERIRTWLKGHDITPLKRPHRTMGRFAWTRILEPDRARYRYRTGSWGKGIKVRYAINIREANKRKGRRNRWQLAIDYWPPSEDNPPTYHWIVKKGAITAPRVGDNREEFAEGFAFSRAAARRAAKRAVDALERGEGPLPVQYELRPGKPGRRNLELLTTKPGKILPVSNPAFNIREATKQMILLEEHLSVPAKRCPDCIGKHLLAIEALADEAACLDKRQELGRLPGELGALSRKAQGDLLSGADPYRVAQDIRAVRKKLLKRVFPYKKP